MRWAEVLDSDFERYILKRYWLLLKTPSQGSSDWELDWDKLGWNVVVSSEAVAGCQMLVVGRSGGSLLAVWPFPVGHRLTEGRGDISGLGRVLERGEELGRVYQDRKKNLLV